MRRGKERISREQRQRKRREEQTEEERRKVRKVERGKTSGGRERGHEKQRTKGGEGRPEGPVLGGPRKAPYPHLQNEKGRFLGKICSAFKSNLPGSSEPFGNPSCALAQKPISTGFDQVLWGQHSRPFPSTGPPPLLTFQTPIAETCSHRHHPPHGQAETPPALPHRLKKQDPTL